MTRSFAHALTLLALTGPTLAQTYTLPHGEIRSNGDTTFSNALKLGMRDGNRTVITPDTLQILGSDSTSDASEMSATGGGQTSTLGSMLGSLPGLSPSVASTGVPGLDIPSGWFVYQRPGSFQQLAAFRVQREVPASGAGAAVPGTYKGIWGITYTAPNGVGYEWAITGEVRNRTLGTTAAQNVAVNGTVFKEIGAVAGQIGPSWGGNFNCTDTTQQVDPIHSCIGAELNSSTNASGTDKNKQRVGLQIAMTSYTPSTGAHFGYGILMGPGPNDVVDRGIAMTAAYDIGLDTTGATFSTAPIYLGGGQRIVFDGSSAGTYSRSLRYDGGSASWAYETISGGTPTTRFEVGDDGVVTFGRVTANSPSASLSLTGSSAIGLDLAPSTLSGPAIRLAIGQEIGWEATGVYKSGLYPSVGYGWKFGNVTVLAVDGNGNATMPGRVTAANYSVGSTAGVSCAAGSVNASTLVITNGIVTHC